MHSNIAYKVQKIGLSIMLIGTSEAIIIKNFTYHQFTSIAVAGYTIAVIALIWGEYTRWLERERSKRRRENRDAKDKTIRERNTGNNRMYTMRPRRSKAGHA